MAVFPLQLAHEFGYKFYETSAKDNVNIREVNAIFPIMAVKFVILSRRLKFVIVMDIIKYYPIFCSGIPRANHGYERCK